MTHIFVVHLDIPVEHEAATGPVWIGNELSDSVPALTARAA